MPFKNGSIVPNATKWTEEMIIFLKDNFFKLTNKQLSIHLGLRLTVTRNKCRELGLKRIEMEYWTAEQTEYLKDNYQDKGDVQLAQIFENKWPKGKRWTKNHICKKRKYLKLTRSPEQLQKIIIANCSPGGKSFTIINNSSSLNMHPTWVAQQIAWRNKELQEEILKHPELIESAKQLIILNRKLKQKINARG